MIITNLLAVNDSSSSEMIEVLEVSKLNMIFQNSTFTTVSFGLATNVMVVPHQKTSLPNPPKCHPYGLVKIDLRVVCYACERRHCFCIIFKHVLQVQSVGVPVVTNEFQLQVL